MELSLCDTKRGSERALNNQAYIKFDPSFLLTKEQSLKSISLQGLRRRRRQVASRKVIITYSCMVCNSLTPYLAIQGDFLKIFNNVLNIGSKAGAESRNSTSLGFSSKENDRIPQSQSPKSQKRQTPPAQKKPTVTKSPEQLINDLKLCLRSFADSNATLRFSDGLTKLEILIEELGKSAKARDPEVESRYVLRELTNASIIRQDAANQLISKMLIRQGKMSPAAIISRWLIHERVYASDETSADDAKDTGSSTTASPPSPFSFRSPIQQEFSPLQNGGFLQPQYLRKKSEMVENMAVIEQKLYRLHCSAESLESAMRNNAKKENENSQRYAREQLANIKPDTMNEASLDIQLKRLSDDRRAYELSVIEAKKEEDLRLREEEIQRRVAIEVDRMRTAAIESAKKQAAEEAAIKRAALLEARAITEKQEAIERAQKAQEDELRQHLAEKEAKRQEEMAKEAEVEAERQKAEFEEQRRQANSMPAVPVETTPGEYGRKDMESERAAISKLLGLLKQVKQKIYQDKELLAKVNLRKRALNPRLGQLNGESSQTNAVVSAHYHVPC